MKNSKNAAPLVHPLLENLLKSYKASDMFMRNPRHSFELSIFAQYLSNYSFENYLEALKESTPMN